MSIVINDDNKDYYTDFRLAMAAKRNCNKCYGRGKLLFDNPSKRTAWVETCTCVHKNRRVHN